MSPEGSPLDLNNFPGDYISSDNDKQIIEDNPSSSTGHRLKSTSGVIIKEVIDENGKVYECRFCSLKFYKSQALGGHMNRHRQERETETLNRARQLVFTSDNLTVHHHHIGGQPVPHGALYNPTSNIGDHNLYRPLYPPPRLFSNPSSTHIPSTQPQPRQAHLLYPPPPPPCLIPYTSPYPPPHDYFHGRFVGKNKNDYSGAQPPHDTIHYTCIGEPIGQDFPAYSGGSDSDVAATGGERGRNYF